MGKSNSTKPLSSLALNSLKPGQLLSDTKEYRGLRVTCGATGVKTFIYRYRSPTTAKIKQIKIGRYKSDKLRGSKDAKLLSLAEARVRFLELKALRDSGICPVEKQAEEKRLEQVRELELKEKEIMDCFTVKAMCDSYIKNCLEPSRTKKATAEARRSLYGDPVKFLGTRPAIDISTQEVYDLIMGVVERGANVQAGFILRELTAAFDYAIDGKLPQDHVNPCYQAKGRIKRKRIRLASKRGTRVLNDGEIATLLKWLPNSKFSPGQKGVIHFTLLTGCRTGEVCGMRWEDVDLEKGIWHLKETKTGVSRDVQLTTQAIEFLNHQKKLNGTYAFAQQTGNCVQQKTLTERMWYMRTKGLVPPIENWTPHDLRRSVRTGLARMGCPSEVAEAVLGHSPKGIEGVYNLHSYDNECHIWLQKWCDHLDALQSVGKVISLGVGNGK